MANLLNENIQGVSGENLEDTLIRLYKTLDVMLSSLNSENVKSLQTDKTKISSSDGYTEIDGAKIIMKDAQETVRLEIGADGAGNFIFNLKNALGDNSLMLSSSGDAVFCGDIETEKSASLGKNLYIGRTENTACTKKIQFFDDENDDSKRVRIEAVKGTNEVVLLNIVADKIKLNTLSGVCDAGGNYYVTATPYSAYVSINGVNYPVIFR